MHAEFDLIDRLSRSDVFMDYSRSFSKAIGLAVALRPAEGWQLVFRGHPLENGFCALMNSRSRACGSCLQAQEKLCRLAKEGPAIVTCANGLMEAAVPVRL